MPIYEYICPKHGKFEALRPMEYRAFNSCPNCGKVCDLMPSRFTHYWFNPMFVDGEGFTSKFMRHEEVAEMDQETRER